MTYGIYSVYDRVTGVYSEPFLAVNKQTAIRRFKFIMQNAKMIAQDCDLFFVGTFDSSNAVIDPKTEFIISNEVETNG